MAEMSSPEASFLFFSSQYISGARSPLAVATSFLLKSWNLRGHKFGGNIPFLGNCILTSTLSLTLRPFPRPRGSWRPRWRARPKGRRCPSRGRLGNLGRPRTDRIFEPDKELGWVEDGIMHFTVQIGWLDKGWIVKTVPKLKFTAFEIWFILNFTSGWGVRNSLHLTPEYFARRSWSPRPLATPTVFSTLWRVHISGRGSIQLKIQLKSIMGLEFAVANGLPARPA